MYGFGLDCLRCWFWLVGCYCFVVVLVGIYDWLGLGCGGCCVVEFHVCSVLCLVCGMRLGVYSWFYGLVTVVLVGCYCGVCWGLGLFLCGFGFCVLCIV